MSRAQRSRKWCAADPGPFRSVAVPDQRCTASLALALRRIRDTIPTVIRHSCLTTSNNTHSLVAARFCVNALSPQHALAGPIPVFSCFSADSDLPSRVLRSQTTRTPPSNTHSLLPAEHFCARVLHRCFAHPNRGVGGAPRNVRVLSGTPVRPAHDAAGQAPSEAPCVP